MSAGVPSQGGRPDDEHVPFCPLRGTSMSHSGGPDSVEVELVELTKPRLFMVVHETGRLRLTTSMESAALIRTLRKVLEIAERSGAHRDITTYVF